MGEPKDMDYLFRTVVHEYSTVILERLTRNKKQGWRFFSAANWFVQGYENYLGLMHSSEHSRNVTLSKHVQCLLAAPERITFDFGITVQDPYTDGTILLTFMHEVYGKEKVQALLVSEQPTFGKAMRVVLADDLTTFADKFTKWMDQKRTSNKEPEATR